jgi:type II secretory pathway pseudopilin PulG
MKLQSPTVFAIGSSVVVLTAIGAGIVAIDSPGEARMRRLDEQRVQDLQSISRAMENYRRTHDGLPPDLQRIIQPNSPPIMRLKDPDSQVFYEYKPNGTDSYELCAEFQTISDGDDSRGNRFWDHGRGKTCFQIEVHLPVKPSE